MSKFPKEALNQHIAVLGKTGSGKTYAAKGLVEHLLDGREYSRDQLAKEAGRGEASSSFGNDISAMKTRELIEYPRPGVVRAAGWLIG